jgi:hypothetical protein
MKTKKRNMLLAALCLMAGSLTFAVQAADDLQGQSQQAIENFQNADSSLKPWRSWQRHGL